MKSKNKSYMNKLEFCGKAAAHRLSSRGGSESCLQLCCSPVLPSGSSSGNVTRVSFRLLLLLLLRLHLFSGPLLTGALTPPLSAGGSPLDTTQNLLCSPSKRPREAGLGSESGQSPGKRPRAGAAEEEAPTQKNRRRCFLCQNRLELVQQELGGCRCGFIFCMRHRLPEQHNCRFDHLGHGRQDAVLKMVKLERKVGRACQRIGEGCS